MRLLVLPAYAGMIRATIAGVGVGLGAPRVCGDDPTMRALARAGAECSPRMRG